MLVEVKWKRRHCGLECEEFWIVAILGEIVLKGTGKGYGRWAHECMMPGKVDLLIGTNQYPSEVDDVYIWLPRMYSITWP